MAVTVLSRLVKFPLLRLLTLAAVTATAGIAGLAGLRVVNHLERDRQTIEEQRQQIETLEAVAARLSADRRIADVLVTHQSHDSDGRLQTSLLFVEYGRDGESLPPRRFTVVGETVHVESKVIKFERHFVAEGDPLRGQSIALFTRIYGSATAPESGEKIDRPGVPPAAYREAGVLDGLAAQDAFEAELWSQFWQLADDETLAREKGVRVAHGQSVWGIFRPGRLYTVELEAAGGLSLRSSSLPGIYREAMTHLATPGTP